MEEKIFYRVSNLETQDGLWYNQKGEFTGLIHTLYPFLSASKLEMPHDNRIVGYLSATESLEELYQWFPKEELEKLENFGYHIYSYLVIDYKFYPPYNHMVINQETSKVLEKLN